jgi:hypothetical protein
LRNALMSELKTQGGRKDIQFAEARKVASNTMHSVPLHQRAGYPLKFDKGAADPKKWMTNGGKQVIVDFKRFSWLPDDWGQGIKSTNRTAHSTGTAGGTYTVLMSPDGSTFYHRIHAEEHAGYKFSEELGRNGQVRLASLQAQQAVQLARAEIREFATQGQEHIGLDKDDAFFKVLSAKERKCLVGAKAFHFCVVSARRATKLEGIRDIFMVQSQLVDAGVTPTWYVDEQSLKDYQKLGLKAVVGGKLTAARNKALLDARKKGKVCVQLSDDISAWEYRFGKRAENRTDEALNAAHAAAKRFIISPVAAARFILAKMRADEDKPQLGGVYMLGSCARSFAGDEFSRKHFILGDFFVADTKTKVLFDASMTLKEDYDFTCSHLKAHGSVMRCNNMTLNVKHYSNHGGACSNRDKKGEEEKKNIAILKRKWPGSFSANPKRQNEVILRWKGISDEDSEIGDGSTDSTGRKRSR